MTADNLSNLLELLRTFRNEFDGDVADSIEHASSLKLAAKVESYQRQYLNMLDSVTGLVKAKLLDKLANS